MLLIYIVIWEWIFFIIKRIFSFPCSQETCCFPWSSESYIYKDIRFIEPLDQLRVDIFKNTCKEIVCGFYKYSGDSEKLFCLNTEDKTKTNNFFELVYHYVVERATHHLYKIQNYVALYGFMRNVSMVFCLLFWISIITLGFNYSDISKHTYDMLIIGSPILYSFFGFIIMIGLHKYKKRFTIEVFQAAAALQKTETIVPGEIT